MRRATHSLLLASLLGAACSADPGKLDPTEPTTSGSTDGTGGASGVSPGTGGTTGTNGSTSPTGNQSGATGTNTGTGSGTGSGTGTGTTTDVTLPPPDTCMPGVPATSQVSRMTPLQYNNTIRDLLNLTDVGGQTPAQVLGLEENRGAMTATEWTAYQNAADKIAKAVITGPNKAQFISCDATDAACLETTVNEFGLKAFRRPLSAEELAQFKAFGTLEPAGTADEIAEAVLFGFLTSPSFIMLPELDDSAKEGETYKLSQYEVATRLATLIWRSTPDADLLAAAAAGTLSTPAQVLEQANRMIAVKEKSGPLLADFHKFYAEINSSSHWNRTEHDPSYFPEGVSKEDFSASMMAEVDQFFAEVANTGRFQDLFLSPVAFINKDNAEIYGEDPSMYTAEFERVELDPSERPGFLTRTAFLSSYSGFTKTSPILRGAYIGQKFLGAAPVPAKAGVPTEPPAGNYKSRREEIDALTAPDDCKGCHHAAINPPGYVMEMYDSMGKIQTVDPLGGPINMVADVTVDNVVTTINNPLELMQAIANGSSGQRRYAERWVEYATGRPPNGNDTCAVEPIAMKLSTDGTYTIVKLLADLTQTEPFSVRSVGN